MKHPQVRAGQGWCGVTQTFVALWVFSYHKDPESEASLDAATCGYACPCQPHQRMQGAPALSSLCADHRHPTCQHTAVSSQPEV